MSDDVRRRRRADDDDDEDDDEEMDDLDDELDGRRSGGGGDRGRRSGRADDVDDDDEDDEEDEDEEDEDEDEGGGGGGRRPRKRARRRAANPFIDEEAAVDDDEDEDDDEEAEDGFEEEAQVAETAFRDESRHRALDRSLQRSEEMNAEDIAERFKQRYGRSELARGGYRGDFDHVPQSVLIPSVNDPKLWLVRCKPGKERDIVTQLMRKFLDPAVAPLSIMSVFCRDSLQGYIYIEADKQAHVMAAIENVQNVYASKLALVPVNEMVDCLTIKAKDVEVKPHSWVRIKRGKYDGDLAQVLEVTESGEMATVKLIPRLEASKDSRTVAAPTMPGKRKKPEVRHPQRLFQPSDYQKRDFQKQNGGYTFQNEFFDKNGYLEKAFKVQSLQLENINPTLEEITRFSGGAINERGDDLAMLATANQTGVSGDFYIGELVLIVRGDLKDIPGAITGVDADVVTIMPEEGYGLTEAVKVSARDIEKRFHEGNHVKVVNGVHKDQTGLVLNVDKSVVTLLSDATLQPIQVFSKDLRAASDATSAAVSFGQFDVQDFVQLSPSEMGVVVKVDKDMLQVLNQYGTVVRVKPQQVTAKRMSAKAITNDANGRPVTSGDTVLVSESSANGPPGGPTSAASKRAVVLHIFRSYVFLHSRETMENGGLLVARNSNVTALSAKTPTGQMGMNGMNGMNGGGNAYNPYGPPAGRGMGMGMGGMGGQQGGGGMGRGRGRGMGGRDPLMGKTVIISGGPYKGYLGIVKDVTPTHARVELHTNNKTINMEKSKLSIPGQSGPVGGSMGMGMGMGGSAPGSARADYGQYDTNTRTPLYATSGAKTPMYRSSTSSATPNPYADGAGGRTPAWDSGSRTPAWNAGSKTPAWDSGSRTPAWDSGSRTPGRPGDAFSASGGNASMPYQNALADTPAAPETPYMPATPGGELLGHGSQPSMMMPPQSHPYQQQQQQQQQQHPQTPAVFPSTPGAGYIPQTPAAGGVGMYPSMASVPHTGIPATPYVPSTPFNPTTPAAALHDYYSAPAVPDSSADDAWLTTDIEVRIVTSRTGRRFRDGAFDGRLAIVRGVDGASGGTVASQVRLLQAEGGVDSLQGVPADCLDPVIPEKKDAFKVVTGEYRHSVGQLLSIDGQEGVVKLDGRTEILMMNLSSLARYHSG